MKITGLILPILFTALLIQSCGNREINAKPVKLEFFETYSIHEINPQWQLAVFTSLHKEVDAKEKTSKTTTSDSISTLSELGTQRGLAAYVKNAGDYAIGVVSPKDKQTVDSILKRKDILTIFPKDLKFVWSLKTEPTYIGSKEKVYVLYAIRVPETGKAKIGGKDIETATADFDEIISQSLVELTMNEEGSDEWLMMTEENIGRILAICADGKVLSAPLVNGVIRGGKTQISGSFTSGEAEELAAGINAGKKK